MVEVYFKNEVQKLLFIRFLGLKNFKSNEIVDKRMGPDEFWVQKNLRLRKLGTNNVGNKKCGSKNLCVIKSLDKKKLDSHNFK